MRRFLIIIATCWLAVVAIHKSNNSELVISESSNPVYLELKKDQMPLDYANKMHIMYGGMEVYGDKMDFKGCKDFVDIETKLNTVRDILGLDKRPDIEGDITTDDVIYNIVKPYEEKQLDGNTKSAYIDDLHTITSGLEEYINEYSK